MMKNWRLVFLSLSLLTNFFVFSQVQKNKAVLVRTITEYNAAVAQAKPGDAIVLSKGIWNDAELLFEANGTATNPITLKVEAKGETILSGASNLRIAGEYLIVEGLVFKN